jgi:hypothetical protein
MSKKQDIIRKALNHKGIPITDGIPEHIETVLRLNGYKIKKRKNKPNASV